MRQMINLNQGWRFTKPGDKAIDVNLPHTWNAYDGADGGNDYWRGTCIYERSFDTPEIPEDGEVWLQFDGVGDSCDVEVNGEKAGHHDGGFATFRFEITRLLHRDQAAANTLKVFVDNGKNDRVYPQLADFTFYGGIYRAVTLVVVPAFHLSLGYLGTNGVKITSTVLESNLTEAKIRVESKTEEMIPIDRIAVRLFEKDGTLISEADGADVTFKLENPHLWNGVQDPYLYTVEVSLFRGDEDVPADCIAIKTGIRCFRIDRKQGFFLNGKSYPLHGVSRHQDRRGMGNAITDLEHDEDMKLIREVGANTIRCAHYQQAQHFYDLCDEAGMVVWTEIPYISQHMPNGRSNTISQLRELIAQNYNHPSICVWGISNEITIKKRYRKDMLDNHHVLNDLCHEMDPTRLTALACYATCPPFHPVAHITDIVSWNLYLGWYIPGFFLNDLWINFFHFLYPKRALGFSEYGAEGMPNIHSAHPKRKDQSEEYQAIYHEYMLRCFRRHPWMWATQVWNMFDFAADARDQGGEPGMNHKGLVTYDRKIKKDSFYLYKAWWSQDPFVHIAGKRYVNRCGNETEIKVYSNQDAVTATVNGKSVQLRKQDHTFTCNVPLTGDLHVSVQAGAASDQADFHKVSKPDPSYKVKPSHKKNNWT